MVLFWYFGGALCFCFDWLLAAVVVCGCLLVYLQFDAVLFWLFGCLIWFI